MFKLPAIPVFGRSGWKPAVPGKAWGPCTAGLEKQKGSPLPLPLSVNTSGRLMPRSSEYLSHLPQLPHYREGARCLALQCGCWKTRSYPSRGSRNAQWAVLLSGRGRTGRKCFISLENEHVHCWINSTDTACLLKGNFTLC